VAADGATHLIELGTDSFAVDVGCHGFDLQLRKP